MIYLSFYFNEYRKGPGTHFGVAICAFINRPSMWPEADHKSIKGYLGAPVKQLKRKAKPSAESTMVNKKNIGIFAVFFSISQPFL